MVEHSSILGGKEIVSNDVNLLKVNSRERNARERIFLVNIKAECKPLAVIM